MIPENQDGNTAYYLIFPEFLKNPNEYGNGIYRYMRVRIDDTLYPKNEYIWKILGDHHDNDPSPAYTNDGWSIIMEQVDNKSVIVGKVTPNNTGSVRTLEFQVQMDVNTKRYTSNILLIQKPLDK